jgi:hypothetical protein
MRLSFRPLRRSSIDRHPPTSPPNQRQGEAARGSLALIGGRFEADNDALFGALRERCDAASRSCPWHRAIRRRSARNVHEFRAQGFYAELVPIFFETRDQSPFDEALIERLRAFGSVFFTGGDQSRIVGTLIQDGRETPALQAIRELYAEGGLIAGSSAGAAIMSGPMLLGGTRCTPSAAAWTQPGGDRGLRRLPPRPGPGFLSLGHGRPALPAARTHRPPVCGAESAARPSPSASTRTRAADRAGRTRPGRRRDRRPGRRPAPASASATTATPPAACPSPTSMTATPSTCAGAAPAGGDKKRVRVGRSLLPLAGTGAPQRLCELWLSRPAAAPRGGGPGFYAQDSARAFDPNTAHQVTLHLRRRPRRSRALRAIRGGEIRYTALDFNLDIHRARLDVCPLHMSTQVLQPDPAPTARLVLLGNTPVSGGREDARCFCANTSWSPSACSPRPRRARQDGRALPGLAGEPGYPGRAAAHRLHNIERASRDRALLRPSVAWAACCSPAATSAA